MRILTRGGYDWTDRLPSIADDARRLAVQTAIIDGEAVVLDEKHAPASLGPSAVYPRSGRHRLLCLRPALSQRRDVRRLPLRERRRLLQPIIARQEAAVRCSEEGDAGGEDFLRAACAHGLEGMIAKHVEKAHRSGRGEWWRKIACKSRNSFVVIGFEPSTVQAISVGLCSPPEGRSSGLCRRLITGWSNQLSRELRNLLEGMVTKTPALALRRIGAVFVEPVLVAKVEYRAWTDDGNCKHASFKGRRPREDGPLFSDGLDLVTT
ncbi:ATP-dependent DNA ligase [Sinorhizobium meliloti]|nr:ATP-dependent DNA ligase [Sinorhizobium meliloti]RVG73984.1 ATP-dependent DNA ligase [Sinorhizobium meliloti]